MLSNRNPVQTLTPTWGFLDWDILEVVKEWKYSGTNRRMILEWPIRNSVLTKGWVIEILCEDEKNKKKQKVTKGEV